MDQKVAIDLMRLLQGELDAESAREWRRRIADDPELQEAMESLRRQWYGLELPDPPPAPPGFATRVLARARDSSGPVWAPVWWSRTAIGKLSSAAILAGGIAVGLMLSPLEAIDDGDAATTTEPSLAESYLGALETAVIDQWSENGR